MTTFIRKKILYFIGALVGGIGGFLYWKYVGCITGTCRITSSPLNSTIYFSLMGSLFFALFQKKSQ
jgi:hypothetical protein